MEPINTKDEVLAASEAIDQDSPTSSAQVPNEQPTKKRKVETGSVALSPKTPTQISKSHPVQKLEQPLEKQEQHELHESTISPNDVLLGRGGGTNRHAGNIFFRDLVSQKQPAYIQARKKEKTVISKSIVATIRKRNGRFMKQENGQWVEVGDLKAAEKASQALREGLNDRMKEIVKEGGVGIQQLKKIGYSVYEDEIRKEEVQKRVQKYERDQEKKRERKRELERGREKSTKRSLENEGNIKDNEDDRKLPAKR